jgi:hypothetical protein
VDQPPASRASLSRRLFVSFNKKREAAEEKEITRGQQGDFDDQPTDEMTTIYRRRSTEENWIK